MKVGWALIVISVFCMIVYVPLWNWITQPVVPLFSWVSEGETVGLTLTFETRVGVVVHRPLLRFIGIPVDLPTTIDDLPVFVVASWWKGSLMPIHYAMFSIFVFMLVSGLVLMKRSRNVTEVKQYA